MLQTSSAGRWSFLIHQNDAEKKLKKKSDALNKRSLCHLQTDI